MTDYCNYCVQLLQSLAITSDRTLLAPNCLFFKKASGNFLVVVDTLKTIAIVFMCHWIIHYSRRLLVEQIRGPQWK